MAGKRKAAHAGDVGGPGIDSASVDYCPSQRKLTQREKLLAYLKQHGNISTAEARDKLRMMSPASRMMELRQAGYCIIRRYDKHQGCGRYFLPAESGGGGDA